MGPLDTQLRCDACGGKLRDASLENCPTCGARIADVGVYQELKDWDWIRKRGAARHIFLRGVLGFGLPLGLLFGIGRVVEDGTVRWLSATASVGLGLVAGLVFGIWHWRAAECQYAHSCNENTDVQRVVRS